MEKALYILKEYKDKLLDVTIEQNGKIAETGIQWLKDFDEAIVELEEAMKPKTCEGCKGNVPVGDVGNFHCWKSRELHYCQANGFIDYCNEFEPKDTQC